MSDDFAIAPIGAAPPTTMGTATDEPLIFLYTNHRGETATRRVMPLCPWFGATEWHREPQWLLRAHDLDKGEERDFAMVDMGAISATKARFYAVDLEQCALFVDSPPLAKSMTDAAAFLRTMPGTDTAAPWETEEDAAARLLRMKGWTLTPPPAAPMPADDHRCFICDMPFERGEMVLVDITEGLGHRACFGDDRDSYVKNLETVEPLGPDDPLPVGEPYDPDEHG